MTNHEDTTAGWTIAEAAERLEPRISYRLMDEWIRARLRPIGTRRRSGPGRPPFVYDVGELRDLHAELVARRAEPRETDQ